MRTLALGTTEDRLVGGLDLEATLVAGRSVLQPGLLSEVDGGVLYIDEVNLLDDHLVDLVIDACAGTVRVEREGLTASLPSRFVLVGTMNPEEGALRPQLLDRFGLCIDVHGESDPAVRAEIIRRRLDHDAIRPSSTTAGRATRTVRPQSSRGRGTSSPESDWTRSSPNSSPACVGRTTLLGTAPTSSWPKPRGSCRPGRSRRRHRGRRVNDQRDGTEAPPSRRDPVGVSAAAQPAPRRSAGPARTTSPGTRATRPRRGKMAGGRESCHAAQQFRRTTTRIPRRSPEPARRRPARPAETTLGQR
ncbi:ChlI component of cobalt chelatase [Cutibacterium acnes JCM 18916]|nr:ChlI component of cobalt chelatase [Cutibacterium acnes JCM 18916]